MKKRKYRLAWIIACFMLLSACKSAPVKSVEQQIGEIGTVTLQSREQIEGARGAYDQLAEKEKRSVSNLNVLTEAEKAYDQLCADHVDELIAQIGKINDDSLEDIAAAEEAYKQLTDEQRGLLNHYQDLLDAKAEYSEYIVQRTTEVLQGLQEADPEETEKYELAEKLYNSLSDDQKALVLKNLNNTADPLQDAKTERVSRLIGKITYKKGVPTDDDLYQIEAALVAYQELPDSSRADVRNSETFFKTLKEFDKYVSEREKVDPLYARTAYMDDCEDVSSDELMSYPKTYKGKKVLMEVQLDQLPSGPLSGMIKAHRTDTEDRVLLLDGRSTKEPLLKEGETLTVYGVYDGIKTITVTEEDSGWLGTPLFGNVIEKYDAPVIRFEYASNDNPVVITGDPAVKELSLDPEREAQISRIDIAYKELTAK